MSDRSVLRSARRTLPRSPALLDRACGRGPDLERLEPRVHLSAFTYQSLVDAFNIPGVLHDLTPPEGMQTAGYGAAAARLGDIDGDGYGDFAIAAPGRVADGGNPAIPGRVFLYSGRDGQLLRTLEDGSPEFGFALLSVGDIDGDGVSDLAVGSPLWSPGGGAGTFGAVHIFSGADGSALRFFTGMTEGGEFGRALALLGDVTGDAMQEVIIGAPGAGPGGEGRAFVVTTAQVFALMPGAEIIYTFAGEAPGDRFGAAVHSPGDVGPAPGVAGDGVPDIFIGAPRNDAGGANAGRAYLFDGATSALRFTLTGHAAGDEFGTALGSTVASGAVYLFVGAPGHDPQLTSSGAVLIDAGEAFRFTADGEPADLYYRFMGTAPGQRYGTRITTLGDLSGDGVPELAFSAPGAAAGQRVSIRSGGDFGAFLPDFDVRALLGARLFEAGGTQGFSPADVIAPVDGEQRVRVLSPAYLQAPAHLRLASPDLKYVFWASRERPAQQMPFAYFNGQLLWITDIPGLQPGDMVRGVSNAGLMIVQAAGPGGLFVVQEGVRTPLADAVTSVQGPASPDFPRFEIAEGGRISATGAVLFNEIPPAAGEPSRAWLFQGGVLTFLWNGIAGDLNDAGQVVGARTNPDGSTTPVLRNADGTVVQLTGLSFAQQINNLGHIAGVRLELGPQGAGVVYAPAVLRDGVVTILGYGLDVVTYGTPRWTILDFDDAGRVAASVTWTSGRSVSTASYLFKPMVGLAPVQSFVFGQYPPSFPGQQGLVPVRLGEGGRVAVNTGVLNPVPEETVWSTPPGAPLGPSAGPSGPNLATINIVGNPVLLRLRGPGEGKWTGIRMGDAIDPASVRDVISYVDRRFNHVYAFIFIEDRVLWARRAADGENTMDVVHFGAPSFPLPGDPRTTIIANQTLFQTATGLHVLAGTDANGHLVIYYQIEGREPSDPLGWGYDNLTLNHIAASGETFTPVAGNLVGFGAPWGSNHIAYLDGAWQVHAVWIPGNGAQWRTVNLSELSGARPLSGRVTAFITPWNAMHVNAVNADGEMTSVWWAPGSTWRATEFAPEGAPRFNAASVSTFVTPWNALNVVGLDADTGRLTAYWWTPVEGVWRADQLKIGEGVPENLALGGVVTATATPAGQLNIFARQDDGEIARFFWELGDGDVWTYQNVTRAAALRVG